MADSPPLRLLTWQLGRNRYGAPAAQVREIVASGARAGIPGAPGPVLGVTNVRGELLTVVDARRLLGEPGEVYRSELVVALLGSRAVALAVDRVEDLVEVTEAGLRPGPEQGMWTAQVDQGPVVRVLDLEELLGPLFAG